MTINLEEKEEMKNTVSIDYVGLKYVFRSNHLIDKISDFSDNANKRYMIPKIDDDGNFTGSLMMYMS
jgi:hypothetical protein